MLTVKTPEEVQALLEEAFPRVTSRENVPLDAACGRVLAQAVESGEYIPAFDRSTVDGYAVRASDTFGCSDAMPAVLTLAGEILMGGAAPGPVAPGCCMAIPTGGALPEGADAVVMLEHAEDYGDGTVGICKPAAPGQDLILRGDDARPGRAALPAGRLLTPQDIGALAALGILEVPVRQKPRAGILSTGDEIVPAARTPGPGQVRDVNSAMLKALCQDAGAQARCFGIVPDRAEDLAAALDEAARCSDVVLLSGGSSVGAKDAAARVLEHRGELLLHGIAMKPGKPTLVARVDGKPVFGLPGHPAAAFFAAQLFVRPLLARMQGREVRPCAVPAVLTESVSANHGRAQYGGVSLIRRDGTLYARPIRGKSGLITALAASDGWFCIPRDCEGAAAGETVSVYPYHID